MQEVYLDNSATTPMYKEVIEFMSSIQSHVYGNPSSLHRKGLEAEKEVKHARNNIAYALGAVPEEIIFTSGGTESNNIAIKGAAYRYNRKGKHIITTPIEHPSTLTSIRQLQSEGYEVSFLNINEDGTLDLTHLENLIRPHTILISINHVNNETGTIQNLSHIGKTIREKNSQAIFHVDGVQALGKLKIDLLESNIDLLSLSAHKLHGPKGVGALWVKKGIDLHPLFQGGDQEKKLRPGTENVAGIAGFGKAVSLYFINMREHTEHISQLKNILYANLKDFLEIKINGPSIEESAPHILNVLFPGIKGEILLHYLEEKGVFVSTGSACHSRRPDPSHVLTAIGLEKEETEASLRFSLSSFNTSGEIEYASQAIITCVQDLQELMGRGGKP